MQDFDWLVFALIVNSLAFIPLTLALMGLFSCKKCGLFDSLSNPFRDSKTPQAKVPRVPKKGVGGTGASWNSSGPESAADDATSDIELAVRPGLRKLSDRQTNYVSIQKKDFLIFLYKICTNFD